MSESQNARVLRIETMYASLLDELQMAWDEVGEMEEEREKTMLEIENECREVYKRKIDGVKEEMTRLRHAIADSEAKLMSICSAMGESPLYGRQSEQSGRSLKEEMGRILQQIEDMQKRKSERRNQFIQVLCDIQCVSDEINGRSEDISSDPEVDESDLSLRKLEELHRQLYTLQEQKRTRLRQIQDHLRNLESLCLVLGLDFRQTAFQIHPSLVESEGSKCISNEALNQLASSVQQLYETKIQRMQDLQDLLMTMLEYWNLMDTPVEEQQRFRNITSNIAATVSEITEPNSLSLELLEQVRTELCRLEEVKWSKMKELVLKKRSELQEICRKTHIVLEPDIVDENVMEAIESGEVNPENILEQIELEAAKVKEEALSRKDILEKVEKWFSTREEENWLEEYNQDENRYNTGKGTHLILKRAEKARILVNKIPGMVEALVSKTAAWESERKAEFLYDGCRLLSMLEEYTELRQEREQERRRKRDQKKLQGQLPVEQEAITGSNTSPLKPAASGKKSLKVTTNKRVASVSLPQTPRPGSPQSAKSNTPQSRLSRKIDQRF
ncbi:PREDICTED: 65-kDa microtubule-associated protein 9 isoform X2 [Tarenaya hassleriana]|nr:PREDICTED: 65-kDa microtubule-associated protein 9 isoform X2 [Tarenaya hassleriana]XP_010550566.1 PREDICTED: 65-kDa microtubule-associated protein 9 isoform X2 [Tarenaya hassleriana]XP_010550567.1 PREDICTED: 65-kDa microtubule-associated protein 9 isoform X2 [Tarenaya hassleriana]